MHAFVDESYTDSTYTFGACLIEQRHMEHAREQMRSLLLPGQKKVHWTKESDKRRFAISDVVAGISMERIAIVREGSSHERHERQRRLCLAPMLRLIDAREVTAAWFESRNHRDDARDDVVVSALRSRFDLGAHLRVNHVFGSNEPLLWIADAICGAVEADRRGNSRFADRLGDVEVTLIG